VARERHVQPVVVGVFIRTPSPFAPGENVILRFQLPEQTQPIRAMGRVVLARTTDPGKWGGTGMGIQFVDLRAEQRDAIERHLANLVASQLGADAEAQ